MAQNLVCLFAADFAHCPDRHFLDFAVIVKSKLGQAA